MIAICNNSLGHMNSSWTYEYVQDESMIYMPYVKVQFYVQDETVEYIKILIYKDAVKVTNLKNKDETYMIYIYN